MGRLAFLSLMLWLFSDLARACVSQEPSLLVVSEKNIINIVTGTRSIPVKIINNDSYTCPSSQFSLSANLPAELHQLETQNTVKVPPGGSVILEVLVEFSNLETGLYSFSVTLNDSDSIAPAHSPVSADGSFFVDSALPTTPQNLVATSTTPDIVNLVWEASEDFGAGLFYYEIYRDQGYGFQRMGAAHYGPYYEDWYASGSPKYFVVAVDRAGNRSAPSNISQVTVATKGGGPKKTDSEGSGKVRGKK